MDNGEETELKTVAESPAGSSLSQSKPPHIRKVYMRNFINFEGDTFLDFTVEDTNGVVFFIGENNTGKTTIMELAETCVNTLKNISYKYDDHHGVVPSPDRAPRQTITDVLTGDNRCCKRLVSQNKSMEAVFIVQTYAAEGGFFYYGLYTPPDEGFWKWQARDNREPYKYSPAFTYHTNGNLLCVVLPTEKAVKERKVISWCNIDSVQEDQVMDSLGKEILKFTRGEMLCHVHEDSRYPKSVKTDIDRLPWCVCTEGLLQEALKCPEGFSEGGVVSLTLTQMQAGEIENKPAYTDSITNKTFDFDRLPSGARYSDFFYRVLKALKNAACVLFEEPLRHMHPSLVKRFLYRLGEICKEKGIQVFLTSHNPDALKNVSFQKIVRFRRRIDGSHKADIIGTLLAEDLEIRKLALHKCFFAKMVLLVEGAAEENLFEALINYLHSNCPSDWIEEEANKQKLKDLFLDTVVVVVGKPENFALYAKTLMNASIPHFICCNGHLLFGVKPTEMLKWNDASGKFNRKLDESPILKDLLEVYSEAAKSSNSVSFPSHRLEDLKSVAECRIGDAIRKLMPSPTEPNADVWKFCQTVLLTFAWQIEGSGCGILDIIDTGVCTEDAAYKMSDDEIRDLVNQIIQNRSQELKNFLNFVEKNVLPMYEL